MAIKTLFGLVASALPTYLNPEILKQYGKQEWWDRNERLACAYALRKCSLINWQAYLENYPDVKKAGVDPVLHFLNDGVFEGRRIFAWPNAGGRNLGKLKVSIIVANYNDEVWLEHCLESLAAQTLREIEIIMVDDGSTDGSREIMKNFASRDSRFRIIMLERNMGLHMARKAGVASASGQYIMFVDADDSLKPSACATAYEKAVRGYDIVAFGTEVLVSRHCDTPAAREVEKWMNGGETREYKDSQICEFMFLKKAPSRAIPTKIFEASLVKAAFEIMEDFEIYSGEDVYEIAALAATARTMLKIPDRLYIYRMGFGHSTTDDPEICASSALEAAKIAEPLKRLTQKLGLERYYQPLMQNISMRCRNAFLKLVQPEAVTRYFDAMAEDMGITEVLGLFATLTGSQYDIFATKMSFYRNGAIPSKGIKSIGFLYGLMYNGGAERVMAEAAGGLTASGYSMTIFLNHSSRNDLSMIPDSVNVAYLGAVSEEGGFKYAAYGLIRALKEHPVDVMICHDCASRYTLLYAILLKYLGVRVIYYAHGAFYSRLLRPGNPFNTQSFLASFRNADFVIGLSKYDELFYRSNGINCAFLANPIRIPTQDTCIASNFELRRDTIIIFSRLGDEVKNVNDCLKILNHIVKFKPWVRMIFKGSFADDESEKEFFSLADKLGVKNNIRITGWIEDSATLLDKAAVLLSTAWHEAFPLSISEAQAHGLPAIIYDLPITIADDNPSIIKIKHGDIVGAANAIMNLIDNEERWKELSHIAAEKMQEYCLKNYLVKFINMLNTFQTQSPVRYYTPEDYNVVMRTIARYWGDLPPWRKK